MKKALSVMMTGVLSLGVCVAQTGCSREQYDPEAIQVLIAKLGYGTQWAQNIATAYEQKTGTKVQFTEAIGQQGNTSIKTQVESLASNADIVFQQGNIWKKVYSGSVSVNGVKYDTLYAELTDMYQSEIEGENGATMLSKMDETAKDAFSLDGKFYSVPWAKSISGIVCNHTVWENLGMTDDDIPLTTNQLFDVCDRIVAKNQKASPFIYCSADEYYTMFLPVWIAQYEGYESMKWFMQGRGPENSSGEYIYTYDGQKYALEVLQKLVTTPGYQNSASTSLDFTDMQGYFLQGAAAFCVNGSWLEIEMSNYQDVDINYIKTPVISAIVNKTPSVVSAAASAGKTSDGVLADIIAEIDAGKTSSEKYPAVTAEDFAVIKEARGMQYSGSASSFVGYIPSYSSKIDKAKDFLKFMYSDEGLNIYYETQKGARLPFTPVSGYKEIKKTDFRELINKAEDEDLVFYFEYSKTKLYAVADVSATFANGSGNLVAALLGGATADQILSTNTNNIQQRWSTIRQYL